MKDYTEGHALYCWLAHTREGLGWMLVTCKGKYLLSPRGKETLKEMGLVHRFCEQLAAGEKAGG